MKVQKPSLDKLQKSNPFYFQGVIQVRGDDVERVSIVVEQIVQKFSETVHFIPKSEAVRGGFDLQSSSNKFSRKIGKWLYDNYGGELKESETLFTVDKQTGKELFRLSVLYKIPEFFKGEVLKIGSKVICVTALKKNILFGKDLIAQKKFNIILSEQQKNEIEKLKVYRDKVVSLKPLPQVLDPETYQPVVLRNADKDLRVGKWVRFVVLNSGAYLINFEIEKEVEQ